MFPHFSGSCRNLAACSRVVLSSCWIWLGLCGAGSASLAGAARGSAQRPKPCTAVDQNVSNEYTLYWLYIHVPRYMPCSKVLSQTTQLYPPCSKSLEYRYELVLLACEILNKGTGTHVPSRYRGKFHFLYCKLVHSQSFVNYQRGRVGKLRWHPFQRALVDNLQMSRTVRFYSAKSLNRCHLHGPTGR